MSCNVCGKVRAHLPDAIRQRLEAVERRIAENKARSALPVPPPKVGPP